MIYYSFVVIVFIYFLFILGCLLVRVGSLFSFWLCEKAVSPMVSLMLFRTFFIAFFAARHVFPSEISYAKVASGDSNLCMNLG